MGKRALQMIRSNYHLLANVPKFLMSLGAYHLMFFNQYMIFTVHNDLPYLRSKHN